MKPLLSRILFASFAAFTALPAQASQESDPWEGFNRTIFVFNDTLDRYLLRPVAIGYDTLMPSPLQSGFSNFFGNLQEVRTIANGLFQAKFAQAGLDSTRFLVNSTVGMAGFIDIGSRIGLEEHDEDFGQTLGYWGVGPGPYLMLPLLGPSTVRDAAGKIPDYYNYSPYNEIEEDSDRFGLYALDVVDTRARLLEAEKLVAGDRYSFFREAYLQRRAYLVRDGVMDDEFLEEDELFEDEGGLDDSAGEEEFNQ